MFNFSGIGNFTKHSIHFETAIPNMSNVEVIVLVITRWNDIDSRNFIRNMIGHYYTNIQLFFVFGLPNSTNNMQDYHDVHIENLYFKDMIIPGEKIIRSFFINGLESV